MHDFSYKLSVTEDAKKRITHILKLLCTTIGLTDTFEGRQFILVEFRSVVITSPDYF